MAGRFRHWFRDLGHRTARIDGSGAGRLAVTRNLPFASRIAMRPLGDDPRHLSWQAINALAWWRLNRSGELSPPVGHGQDFYGRPRLRLWDDAMGLGGGSEPMTLTVFKPLFS